ncbi:small acid-soluble spore protein P [Paenibacillus sp. NEAU-GSW1]|nr:small acid-soluble spore protein P [Paenibacillus sp. NEAU-GSW1]MUT67945.1 small acid-soluble spore protein P [Paenibacillus sp. NEAU-GSW1]
MGKSKTFPVPDADGNGGDGAPKRGLAQKPLSGSKKAKQHNHVSHHNPQG